MLHFILTTVTTVDETSCIRNILFLNLNILTFILFNESTTMDTMFLLQVAQDPWLHFCLKNVKKNAVLVSTLIPIS